MRLIDADALYKDICDSLNEMTRIGIAVDGEWLWGKLNDSLENAPTIEPEPQRTGRWIQIEESIKVSNYKCSECGRTIWDDRGYDPYVDYPYCHCGARMEGEG